MYDVIGDIHGHYEPLAWMLERLGYDRRRGYYSHPERKVVFLGDWIDRGPCIREVMQLVRPMVDRGAALAVLGNHELNAICYHTRSSHNPAGFIRSHALKNVRQHWQTLQQLSSSELYELVDWFRRLPLWLELDGLRVIHACWDDHDVRTVQQGLNELGGMSQRFLELSRDDSTPLGLALQSLLKGKELPLPAGRTYVDKDGNERQKVRTRWFDSPVGRSFAEYALPAIDSDELLSGMQVPDEVTRQARVYPSDAPPVFVGHYWLRAQRPARLAANVACLDYSVAADGMLCAYRWDGEAELDDQKFVTVQSKPTR